MPQFSLTGTPCSSRHLQIAVRQPCRRHALVRSGSDTPAALGTTGAVPDSLPLADAGHMLMAEAPGAVTRCLRAT